MLASLTDVDFLLSPDRRNPAVLRVKVNTRAGLVHAVAIGMPLSDPLGVRLSAATAGPFTEQLREFGLTYALASFLIH